MTTLKQQMASDVEAIFQNTDEFAETWQHWPKGNQVQSASVVVIPDFPTLGMGEGSERDTSEGDQQRIKFAIYVPDSLTLDPEDSWRDEIENDYQTISLGESQAGLREIVIQRNDKDHTRRHSAGRLL